MGAKSVARGKLLNKSVAHLKKCGTEWGKIYYIKVWHIRNLYSKLRCNFQQKNVKFGWGEKCGT